MKQYTIAKMSGEFRLVSSSMTSEQTEEFVRSNYDWGKDYCDGSAKYGAKEEAISAFDSAKAECLVDAFPCNKVMRISWVRMEECEVDDTGEEDDIEIIDEYFPGYRGF